jgi:hypothetical protein
MSKIDMVAQTTPAVALFNAICAHVARNDIREVLNVPEGSVVDVKLTVNGVEIPFEPTVEHLWKQVNDNLDERAMELAKQIIAGAGLQDLFDRIKRAEWEIGDALEASFKKLGVEHENENEN